MPHSEILLFPDGQVLREGSTVMFCSIFPTETNNTDMFFNNTSYKVINISTQVKAIRVENIKATNGYGVNFYSGDSDDAAVNYVTFPPEKPQDFRCETKDMRNVSCSWKIRRAPNLNEEQRRKYTLLISDSRAVSWNPKSNSTACSFEVVPQQIHYNITLLVTNSLGRESETDIFNIKDRVFPVPVLLDVAAGVLDSVVVLQLNGSFKGLLLSCQLEIEPRVPIEELDKNGSDSVQNYTFRLQNLKPSTQYYTKGRCAVQGNNWGQWTEQILCFSEPLVTIDLWRRIRDDPNRTVTLVWKSVSSNSSHIKAYEVCVSNRNPQRSVCMYVTQKQTEVPLDLHMCNISVRAIIQSGLSIPSHITISPAYTAGIPKEKRIWGNAKEFQLTWMRDSVATCDYIVEWCMLGIASPCNLQWRKVPVNQTSLNLDAGNFKAGVQYTFTIYSCSAEGHRPCEKRIGYVEEQEPMKYPTLDTNPNITWSSVNLKWSFNEEDPSHTGFITGYEITVQEDSEAGSDLSPSKQFVDDPHSKSFTVSGLEEDQLYTFHLAACTSAGCGPETTGTFRTRKNYYLLMAKILIPLLFLVCCCICLWSNRSTLRGFPKETFGFLHIKALDLDEDLYEASEKIYSLRIEDCKWCDVEILPPTVAEKTWLASAEDPSCSFIGPKVTLPSFLTPSYHPTTILTNFTYMSSVQQDVPSELLETPKTEAMRQESEISGFSSDYVTSVAT
ncbi:hypothetical protein PO909_026548 [Leuciscus waleckii]